MSEGAQGTALNGFGSGGFWADGQKLDQPSTGRPGTGQTGNSDSPDHTFRSEERRPSMTSATTVSSQNSWSKSIANRSGTNKKIAPYLHDDSRGSTRSSDVSIPSTLQREQTSSSRHNSVHISYTDGGPASPTSSRPLTPLPSSEVTPWVFQEFKVSFYTLSSLLWDWDDQY